MSISTRLTRAAFAFLVFGIVASMLPSTGAAVADSGNLCPVIPPPVVGGSQYSTIQNGAVAVAAVGIGGLLLALPSRNSKHHTTPVTFPQTSSAHSALQGYLYNNHA